MRLLSVILIIAAAVITSAGPMQKLERCATQHANDTVQANLCMNKILLRQIRRSNNGGDVGHNEIGTLKFYHDDGRCNSAVIGTVIITRDRATNAENCQSAFAGDKIWGYSITVNDETTCLDIRDSHDAASVCRTALRSIGRL